MESIHLIVTFIVFVLVGNMTAKPNLNQQNINTPIVQKQEKKHIEKKSSTNRPTAEEQESAGVVTDYYQVTGTSADVFFKSSAELYVNFRTARILLNNTTMELKKMAMSHVAADVANTNLKDAPTQDSINILKAKKTELRAEEIQYLIKSLIDLLKLSDSLSKSIVSAKDLIPQAVTTIANAKSELTGFKITKLPKVISGVAKAKSQLTDVVNDAPIVAKELLILIEAFKSLTGN